MTGRFRNSCDIYIVTCASAAAFAHKSDIMNSRNDRFDSY